MRTMELLERVGSPAELAQVRETALARGWSPELFDAKAKPVVKRLAKLAKPSAAQVAKAKAVTPKLVEDYGRYTLLLTPHDGSDKREPLPALATSQVVRVRRCQFARKERVAVGPVVVSARAWETLADGGTVRTWVGGHMHYASVSR